MFIKKTLKNSKKEKYLLSSRLIVIFVAVTGLSLMLISRLIYLQIYEYNRYTTLSKKNQLNVIPIPPSRGIIYDRRGVILAENIPVYSLELVPERIKNISKTLIKLKKLLPSLTNEDIKNFYKTMRHNRSFDSLPLKLKLNQEEVALFAVNLYRFPGVNIKARLMRHYPLKEIMAHILGFVGRINKNELNKVNVINYRATNFIGKVGIEKYYENILHGQVGYEQIETDASGRTIRVLYKVVPYSGKKIYLTIDSRLQRIAYDALLDHRGAIVVINPNNGDILAMVSMPSYDPNQFVQGMNDTDYLSLSTSKSQPLYNRAIRGQYPPASTIKPFVALGALEQGIIRENDKIYDPGWYKLPNSKHPYRDWNRHGHGVIDMKRAITVSCDTYFYHLAHLLGIRRIQESLSHFGFGELTHIDMGEELAGLLPSQEWKRKIKKLPWYPGDTLISGIGQGFMLATPLQLAKATASLALKGKPVRPHLLLKTMDTENNNIEYFSSTLQQAISLPSLYHWNIIANAMQNVILSKEGTGFRFGRDPTYTIAGKTGTAQLFSLKQDNTRDSSNIPEVLRDHSSFIAFAPVESPQIAVAVLVENDYIASNIARKVIDAYFELGLPND